MVMGSWTSLIVAYVLGGVTFIPLVIVAFLAHAHRTLPYRPDVDTDAAAAAAASSSERSEDAIVQPDDDKDALDAAKKSEKEDGKPRANHDLDVAAGYFAVCREYVPMGINAKPIERSTQTGSTSVAAPSPSVYQTMYRSIFERKSTTGPLENNSLSQRPKRAGNVFYVVLRHGHMMLFDDEEQIEVRHVISLAHHDISLYSGGGPIPEGELFIKKNAICLSRKRGSPEIAPDAQVSKPFYLFSENCSAKEDFYFALLKNQHQTFASEDSAPNPKQFDVKNIISLVQKLHASEDHIHTRWLNAMIGRMFLALYKTRDLETFICEKITKKISRVKKPSYLTNIVIRNIDTGEAPPYITNLKLKDLTVEGECIVEADVRYTGRSRVEVAATVKIDLGTRFKTREVNIVLAVVLKRLEGRIMFKIKPPPSNRIWFSFQAMPKMEMTIEPIVSSRQITYTVILRQIENRIKEVFAETLVQPFWDDVPFFKTEHKQWRGGIFEGDDAVPTPMKPEEAMAQAGAVNTVNEMEENGDGAADPRPLEKSYSSPIIDPAPATNRFFSRKAARSGANTPAAASSTSVDTKMSAPNTPSTPNMPRSPMARPDGDETALRGEYETPSELNLSEPVTEPGRDATGVHEPESVGDTPLQTPVGETDSPALTQSTSHSSSSSQKEHYNGDRDIHISDPPSGPDRRNTASSTESGHHDLGTAPNSPARSTSSSFKSQSGSLGRNLFRRESASSASGPPPTNGDGMSHKRNTFAAVSNAAAQAGQWSWNQIQRQKAARKHGDNGNHVDLSQPMGRGQPLPPPGMPLPGPTRGSSNATKRKPVPPPALPDRPTSHIDDESVIRPEPPPLPARRRRGVSHDNESEQEEQNMLVIAAPDDSQPATPAADERTDYVAPDVQHLDQTPVQTGPDEINEPADVVAVDQAKAQPPQAARPAHATATDDDDYSGWMVDDEDTSDDADANDGVSSAPVPKRIG